RWAILVHGCFWHRHEGCSRTTTPKRNRRIWLEKFRHNVERDGRLLRRLRAFGYRAHVIWECETFDAEALADELSRKRRLGVALGPRAGSPDRREPCGGRGLRR